ncbi:MAG TPA: hypothetical protein VFL73_02970 [Solirubrobacteraceae bacterium]|nr:hypothetical protein [Solirubrobacteraceae bacterium]
MDQKQLLFEQVARLRRAERSHPADDDIAAVRAALERQLGPVVSQSLAARALGVTPAALRRWITSADLPVVVDASGRSGVPLAQLVELYEEVARSDRSHRLEPVFAEARRRAAELDPAELVGSSQGDRPARRALAYHRALAQRLERPMVDAARRKLQEWQADGHIAPRYANAWQTILARPLPEIRRAISDDTANAADLRQNSPFAGMLSEPERRKIIEHVR